jgi:hypothetical protein
MTKAKIVRRWYHIERTKNPWGSADYTSKAAAKQAIKINKYHHGGDYIIIEHTETRRIIK